MLDSVGYLTSFGWQGRGNGLRQGGVSRPLSIPQKRTLAGLGKDRDEAFPFWDHLFTAAAKSIRINVSGDSDDEADNDEGPSSDSSLLRTTTGLLSNRRPTSGAPARSGSVTPDPRYPTPRLSLVASAKRASARKRLYASFFKGPILGPEVDSAQVANRTATIPGIVSETPATTATNENSQCRTKKRKHVDQEQGSEIKAVKKTKKTKRRDESSSVITEPRRKKRKHPDGPTTSKEEGEIKRTIPPKKNNETPDERQERKAAKANRRRKKEQRRRAREERGLAAHDNDG